MARDARTIDDSASRRSGRSGSVPDMTRAGVGLVTANRWAAADPDQQRALAEASLAAWEELPWPPGLIGHHVASSTDGAVVLNYSQWSDRAAVDRFAAEGLAERAAWVEQRGGPVERLSSVRLRRYRTMWGERREGTAGCLVLVTFVTPGPGEQVALVDGVVHRATTAQPPAPGMLASHFHVSIDGSRVVNAVEFTSADAHQRVVDTSLGDDSPVIGFIASRPGVRVLGFERFAPYGTVSVAG